MKKKLLGFLFAFAFIFTAGVCLTACGGSPSFSSLIIEYNGHTEENPSYFPLGSFEIGTMPNLNYVVKAKYTDGSTKTLVEATDYTATYRFWGDEVPKPQTADDFRIGNYYIEINYNSNNYILTFEIIRVQAQYTIHFDGYENNNNVSWRYVSQQVPEIYVKADGEQLPEENVDICYIRLEYESEQPTEEDLLNRGAAQYNGENILPGYYLFYARVSEHPAYDSGETDYVRVTVEKGLVTLDAEDVKSIYSDSGDLFTYKYTDYGFTSTLTLEDFANYINDKVSYSNMPRATVVGGNYSSEIVCQLEFKENGALNYRTYQTGKPEEVKLTIVDEQVAELFEIEELNLTRIVKVEPGEVYLPSITFDESQSSISEIILLLGSEYGYFNREALTVIEKKIDGEEAPFTSGSTSDTNRTFLDRITKVGTYTYTVVLRGDGNYVWKTRSSDTDTIIDSEPKVLTWNVTEFNAADIKWRINYQTYSGSCVISSTAANEDPHVLLPDSIGYKGGYDRDIKYYFWYDEKGKELDGFSTEVGKYYVVFAQDDLITDGSCFITGDIRLDYEIKKPQDVAGKTFVFADAHIYDNFGNELTSTEGLSSYYQECFARDSKLIDSNDDTATIIFDEASGKILGTFVVDADGNTFADLFNDKPFTYTYNESGVRTISILQTNGDQIALQLEGNFVGNTLTLIFTYGTYGYVFQLTFTLTEAI